MASVEESSPSKATTVDYRDQQNDNSSDDDSSCPSLVCADVSDVGQLADLEGLHADAKSGSTSQRGSHPHGDGQTHQNHAYDVREVATPDGRSVRVRTIRAVADSQPPTWVMLEIKSLNETRPSKAKPSTSWIHCALCEKPQEECECFEICAQCENENHNCACCNTCNKFTCICNDNNAAGNQLEGAAQRPGCPASHDGQHVRSQCSQCKGYKPCLACGRSALIECTCDFESPERDALDTLDDNTAIISLIPTEHAPALAGVFLVETRLEGLAAGSELVIPNNPVSSPQQNQAPIEKPMVDTSPLPLIGQAAQFEREITLPVADGFEWPKATHFEFYAHNAAFLWAWHELGVTAGISVAERRCTRPPPPGFYHFIGRVQDFIEAYPHPIGTQTNHITCTKAAWSRRGKLREAICDGSLLASAEEFHWIMSIGARASGEQPATIIHHLVGPPAFSTNAIFHRGLRDKRWNVWLRHLSIVPDGPKTPDELILPRKSGKDAEKSMLNRTETELGLARSFAPEWMADPWSAPEAGRPASQTCKAYKAGLASLRHNYTLFAAAHAPYAAANVINDHGRARRLLVVVPITHHSQYSRLVALLPLDGSAFALEISSSDSPQTQAAAIARYMPDGAEAHQAFISRAGTPDIVCALPTLAAPLVVLTTPTQLLGARAAGQRVAWCTASALEGNHLLEISAIALARVRASIEPMPDTGIRIGAWQRAQPMIPCSASHAWEKKLPTPDAKAEWAKFIEAERERAKSLAHAFEWAGQHAQPFAEVVVSAADLLHEIPQPVQGLPYYNDDRLASLPYPEPPAPLSTLYFHTLPPQRVPPGFEHARIPAPRLVKRWCRVEVAATLNMTADHDFDCMPTGESPLPRPKFKAWGDGAFVTIQHIDGIGSFRANEIIWMRNDDGTYSPLDFSTMPNDHKSREWIMKIIGAATDQELLSFLLHGVCWKVDAPRQIRVGRNVESLKPRVAKVGRAAKKLIDCSLYKCLKLRRADQLIDPDRDAFFMTIPEYAVGSGGQDKKDNPDEARKTGNTSEPFPEEGATTREDPKGSKEGVPCISFNEMTGPRKIPPDYDGVPLPFPDPEIKSRPRDVSRALVVIRFIASLLDTHVVGVKDDIRWMFWQIQIAVSQLWLGVEHILVPFDEIDPKSGATVEVWYFCAILPYVMNMGNRPASKIACRFSEAILAYWRKLARKFVGEVWLPKQPKRVRDILNKRRLELGEQHGDPFVADVYTDDYYFLYPCEYLCAQLTQIWRQLCHDLNIWMSRKVGAGTIIDTHGGRFVLNGGFSCLVPSKVARCEAECVKAVTSGITRADLRANNSFIVHVDDIINMPLGSRYGIWAPLMPPGHDDDIVRLAAMKDTPQGMKPVYATALDSYQRVLRLLKERPAASFWCAVPDERLSDPWQSSCIAIARASSDACTNPKIGIPYVFGYMHGLYWRFPLSGKWLQKHINITESLGPAGNVIIFGGIHAGAPFCDETDSTAAATMMLGKAKSDDLQIMRRSLDDCPAFAHMVANCWIEHVSGFGNQITDLGSRNEWPMLRRVCAAYNIQLREVPLTDEFLRYADHVMENTSDYYATPPNATADDVDLPPLDSNGTIADRWYCRCRRGCTQLATSTGYCAECDESCDTLGCLCSCEGCKHDTAAGMHNVNMAPSPFAQAASPSLPDFSLELPSINIHANEPPLALQPPPAAMAYPEDDDRPPQVLVDAIAALASAMASQPFGTIIDSDLVDAVARAAGAIRVEEGSRRAILAVVCKACDPRAKRHRLRHITTLFDARPRTYQAHRTTLAAAIEEVWAAHDTAAGMHNVNMAPSPFAQAAMSSRTDEARRLLQNLSVFDTLMPYGIVRPNVDPFGWPIPCPVRNDRAPPDWTGEVDTDGWPIEDDEVNVYRQLYGARWRDIHSGLVHMRTRHRTLIVANLYIDYSQGRLNTIDDGWFNNDPPILEQAISDASSTLTRGLICHGIHGHLKEISALIAIQQQAKVFVIRLRSTTLCLRIIYTQAVEAVQAQVRVQIRRLRLHNHVQQIRRDWQNLCVQMALAHQRHPPPGTSDDSTPFVPGCTLCRREAFDCICCIVCSMPPWRDRRGFSCTCTDGDEVWAPTPNKLAETQWVSPIFLACVRHDEEQLALDNQHIPISPVMLGPNFARSRPRHGPGCRHSDDTFHTRPVCHVCCGALPCITCGAPPTAASGGICRCYPLPEAFPMREDDAPPCPHFGGHKVLMCDACECWITCARCGAMPTSFCQHFLAADITCPQTLHEFSIVDLAATPSPFVIGAPPPPSRASTGRGGRGAGRRRGQSQHRGRGGRGGRGSTMQSQQQQGPLAHDTTPGMHNPSMAPSPFAQSMASIQYVDPLASVRTYTALVEVYGSQASHDLHRAEQDLIEAFSLCLGDYHLFELPRYCHTWLKGCIAVGVSSFVDKHHSAKRLQRQYRAHAMRRNAATIATTLRCEYIRMLDVGIMLATLCLQATTPPPPLLSTPPPATPPPPPTPLLRPSPSPPLPPPLLLNDTHAVEIKDNTRSTSWRVQISGTHDTTPGMHNPSMAPSPFAQDLPRTSSPADTSTPPMLPNHIRRQAPTVLDAPRASRHRSEAPNKMADADLSKLGGSLANIPGSADAPRHARIHSPPYVPTPPMTSVEQLTTGQASSIDLAWQLDAQPDESHWHDAPSPPSHAHEASKRSPQPVTAAGARRAAAQDVADKLCSDISAYAIMPNQPARLRQMCLTAAEERIAAIPHGTAKSDAWGFGWAMRFGVAHDTPWMRPREVAPEDQPREAIFYAFLMMWLAVQMTPSKRTRSKGFTQAKPDSVMGAIYGYRRVLRDCGRYLAPLHEALQQLKALRRAYLQTFGDFALVPHRAQPFSQEQIMALINALVSLSMIGWTEATHWAMLVMISALISMGMRNDELALTPSGTFMKRANFSLFVNGAELEPTIANFLLALASKAPVYIRGRSVKSKCDQSNYHWGARDMWFILNVNSAINFANRWIRWEIKYPCPPSMRGLWPAFSPTGSDRPFTTAQTAKLHRDLCMFALDPSIAGDVTIHWWRVTLATKSLADGNCDGTTQALVRWKSVEAMRIYARLKPSQYATCVERAIHLDVGKRTDLVHPEIDPHDAIQRVNETITELENQHRDARKRPQHPAAASSSHDEATYIVDGGLAIRASTAEPPVNIIGDQLSIPNAQWPGYEGDVGSTRVTVIAFAPSEGKYVAETPEDGLFTFTIDALRPHFTQAIKKRLSKPGTKRGRPT